MKNSKISNISGSQAFWVRDTQPVYPEELILKRCVCALLRSLQHYSQYTKYGSNLNVHQMMNFKSGADIPNRILFSLKKRRKLSLVTTWIKLEVKQAKHKKTNTVWSY